jgi:hypothetical protein
LSWEATSNLDHALADYVGMMPWPRFRKILTAAVLDADPDLAAERAERARTTQDVYGFDSEDGLKTIVAKATAGNAVWFLATVNRIADILAGRGDTDPVGTRRARAVGILARPAEALQLLIQHQPDPDPADGSADNPQNEPRDEPAEANDHQSLSLQPPAGFHAAAARPRVVLHFHLTEDALKHGNGMVRPEHGEPLRVNQLVEFLASAGCSVRVQPVLDPAGAAPIDGYEVSPGCGRRCGTGRSLMCSRSAPAPARAWTWTTPSPTCR